MLGNPATAKETKLSVGKRRAEELYVLSEDPHETVNVAGKPEYAYAQKKLRAELDAWMARTGDPCAFSNDDRW